MSSRPRSRAEDNAFSSNFTISRCNTSPVALETTSSSVYCCRQTFAHDAPRVQFPFVPLGPSAGSSSSSATTGSDKKERVTGDTKKKKKPVVCIVMGMAGSGKTTLLQRLNLYTTEMGIKSYFINLDPAVKQVPFGASIDIRDTVNYKEVRAFLRIVRRCGCCSAGPRQCDDCVRPNVIDLVGLMIHLPV